MMKRSFHILLLMILPWGISVSQEPVKNSLLRMTPLYRNPACLSFDETASYTIVGPTASVLSGDMRRLYDPGSLDGYDFTSQVVRLLGSKGTFRAKASYMYENRRDIWSSLRLYAYEGDGFLPADTTFGNFRFSGPEVRFEYGYELFPRFAIGFLCNYWLFDGLKDAFTNAHTMLRSVDFGGGIRYQSEMGDCLSLMVLGVDDQERIESKSNDDLKDVAVFSYRGDTYATRRRTQTLEEMLRTKGIETSIELRHVLSSMWTIEGRGRYFMRGFRSLFPSGYLVEYEDGYSQFRSYAFDIALSHHLNSGFLVKAGAAGGAGLSWSRISSRDLLFWEWSASDFGGYLDAEIRLSETTALAVQPTFSIMKTDSSKYIDNRFAKMEGNRYGIRAELTTKALGVVDVVIMSGVHHLAFDVLRGGNNVNSIEVFAQISYPLTSKLLLTGNYYGEFRNGNILNTSIHRRLNTVGLTLKILQD